MMKEHTQGFIISMGILASFALALYGVLALARDLWKAWRH